VKGDIMSIKNRIENLERSMVGKCGNNEDPPVVILASPPLKKIDMKKDCAAYLKQKNKTGIFNVVQLSCIGCTEKCQYAFDGSNMGTQEKYQKAQEYWDSLIN
jgi:hypothetical protein